MSESRNGTTEETLIVETVVGSWTEDDYIPEDSWKGLCTAYRRIMRINYRKVESVSHGETNDLLRSLEMMS